MVKQVAGHGGACASVAGKQQGEMANGIIEAARNVGRVMLDYALPPRCAGCGDIIDEVDAFCPNCWGQMEWLGNNGCQQCGLPLAGTESETCGRCLAEPPRLERMRAAVAYGDLSRSLVLRLKYGRKVALARTMARYMAPLEGSSNGEAILVPVPLHRWRLWGRGFNQAALLARELSKHWQLPAESRLLRRIRATRPLKGLNHGQRRRAMSAAFAVAIKDKVRDRRIILVDDVLTSGSTAEACARALRSAGAARVELICWARVVRPGQLMR